MTPGAIALVADFEAAAKTAQAAEAAARKKAAEEIARVERARVFAFRRIRLVRLLAGVAAGAATAEAAIAAQRQVLCAEFGWTSESAAHREILAELDPVAETIWHCACGEGAQDSRTVTERLARFEQWFEGARGKPFYSLFDQYVPEVPVVDF
jgi:hypothetical protein